VAFLYAVGDSLVCGGGGPYMQAREEPSLKVFWGERKTLRSWGKPVQVFTDAETSLSHQQLLEKKRRGSKQEEGGGKHSEG